MSDEYMRAYKTILSNKLRVIAVPIPSSESATVTVWVRTGSRFESRAKAGISHFVEHMVFKGSKDRPTAAEVFEAIDYLGAAYNASTDKECTNFYIKARVGVIEKVFDILSDLVLNPVLDRSEIEKEKGVIIQEMHLYDDNPIMKIGEIFENIVYKGASIEHDIIGTQKAVNKITDNDLKDYRKIHYYSENMLLTVAGGVPREKVENLAQKYFSALNKQDKEPSKPSEKITQSVPQLIIKYKKTDQTHMVIGYKGQPAGADSRYAEGLLGIILGGGASSRLMHEIREKRGLAYAVRTSSDHRMDNGYIATYSGLKTERIEEAIKVILEEHNSIANGKKPILNKELIKAKEYIKGHIALSLEDTDAVNDFFGVKELLLGKIETPDEVYKAIDKVTIEEIVGVAKEFFKPERLNLAIIGPFKDESRFKGLLS